MKFVFAMLASVKNVKIVFRLLSALFLSCLILSPQVFAYAPTTTSVEASVDRSTTPVNKAVIFKSTDDVGLVALCEIDLGLHPQVIPSFLRLDTSIADKSRLNESGLPDCSPSKIEMVEAIVPKMQIEPKLALLPGLAGVALGVVICGAAGSANGWLVHTLKKSGFPATGSAAGVAGALGALGGTMGAGALLKTNYIATILASYTAGFCALAGGAIGYFWDSP